MHVPISHHRRSVPKHSNWLRLTVSSEHTQEQLEDAVRSLREAGQTDTQSWQLA